MHIELMYRNALLHQEELLADAARERLAQSVPPRETRKPNRWFQWTLRGLAFWRRDVGRWMQNRVHLPGRPA
jgi:hypothetical protein